MTTVSTCSQVAPASRDDLAEVLRLRTLLEPMALRMAIERGDDAWEAEVLTAHHRLGKLEERRAADDDGGVAGEWEQWHRAFHDMLIQASGSPILLQFCRTLHDMNDRYRRIYLRVHRFDRDVAGEHQAILKATLARDGERSGLDLARPHVARRCVDQIPSQPGGFGHGHETLHVDAVRDRETRLRIAVGRRLVTPKTIGPEEPRQGRKAGIPEVGTSQMPVPRRENGR